MLFSVSGYYRCSSNDYTLCPIAEKKTYLFQQTWRSQTGPQLEASPVLTSIRVAGRDCAYYW